MTNFLNLAAILSYLIAIAVRFYGLAGFSTINPKQRLLILGGVAVILHAFVLHQGIVTPNGLNLGIFNAASLVTWVIALLLLLSLPSKPIENLIIVLFPSAALALAIDYFFYSEHILAPNTPTGVQIHVFYSILAYSILSISALQAIFLAIQDYELRHKRLIWVLHRLPPLQVMETFLLQMIALGVLFLSLSLISGFLFLEDIFAQHLVHKTVLSIIAWWVFVILLWGRWRYGWRGQTVIRWNLSGFFVLMLAYFGSKLVLELILDRV